MARTCSRLSVCTAAAGARRIQPRHHEQLHRRSEHPTGLGEPRTAIPASSAVTTYVDVVLPRSAGRTVPKRLHNRITYTLPAGAPVEAIIGSRTVDAPVLRVDRRLPIRIAPPLRGSGWLSANACCGDPSLNHRTTMLANNGTYVTPEVFAVDYIRMVDRPMSPRSSRATPPSRTRRRSPAATWWSGSGAACTPTTTTCNPAHCGSRSVSACAPGSSSACSATAAHGRPAPALRDHRRPESADVRQPPFQIDRFRFGGTAAATETAGVLTLTGRARQEHWAHPLATSVSDYSR
jgi:hypothetical protein